MPPRSRPRQCYGVAWSRRVRLMETQGSGARELAGRGTRLFRHEREVAVALADVEAITHDEDRRDVEADVPEIELDTLETVLDQERTDLERCRLASGQVLAKVRERQAGVDDVLHDHHVAI